MVASPYENTPVEEWAEITNRLIDEHPLSIDEIVEVVLSSWGSIFASKMGSKGFTIGKDLFPKPQIMGFFLHELIPLEFAARHPGEWRPERDSSDKDIVYVPDDRFSIELKTSSSRRHIYGNRSYAQKTSEGKKAKSGYYLAVNFQKFGATAKRPQICLVRFGWIDAGDWVGQRAATGQQSRLMPEVENTKLATLYPAT